MSNLFLNNLGLIFDIVGASLLWYFGLPPNVSKDGSFKLNIGSNETEKRKANKFDCLGKLGFIFLVLGFILQLISNF